MSNTPDKKVFSMKDVGQIFIKGALVLLPLFVSIYVLIWLAASIDGIFGQILKTFNPTLQLPSGFGLIIGVSIIFIVGLTSDFFIARTIKNLLERLMDRIPVIGTIFNSIKSFADYLNPKNNTARGQTVVAHFPSKENSQYKLVGFMTQTSLKNMPTSLNGEDLVTVYFPMSYQVGGYTVFIKRNQIEEVDLSFEKAMQGTLTGWIQIDKK